MADFYSMLGDKQWVTGGFQSYRRLEKGYCCKEYQVTFFNQEVTPIVRSENGLILQLSPVAIAQVRKFFFFLRNLCPTNFVRIFFLSFVRFFFLHKTSNEEKKKSEKTKGNDDAHFGSASVFSFSFFLSDLPSFFYFFFLLLRNETFQPEL
jgi:hypothetical protein